MTVPFVLSMVRLTDPFARIRKHRDRQFRRSAFSNISAKPRMTPEEARRDHRLMLRFLGLNALAGVVIGIVVALALVLLDIGGLGRLVSRASNPVIPLVLMIVPFASLFGAAVAGSAILTLPYERKYRDDDPAREDKDDC